MADKSVGELVAAQSVTPTDLFVLEQNGTAKKLTGQILENWLVSFADGHGGIQSIAKLGTSGLADTYRITLADTTTFDFVVTNGRGVSSLRKTGTSGLVDTYTFTYNDGTKATFTVTNGQKGDKGDNAYIWVKYASQEPTASSNSFGDLPDDWMGVYFGTASTAPTDWKQYKWYRIKGEKGDTGEPATIVSAEITYQASDSGTIIPSGSWSSSVPPVTPGRYLWTRQVLQFNAGNPITSYSVSRFGIDGTGAVSTVAGVAPDENGNVPLDASSVKALAITGGTMEGAINMNGQPLSGLNAPTKDNEAATKGYVDTNKVDKDNVVNNFTTTEEGFVADARALKTLKDMISENKLSMDLLWQNASPQSTFNKVTTLTIASLSEYDAIMIIANFNTSLKQWLPGQTFAFDKTSYNLLVSSATTQNYYRSFTMADNGLEFTDGSADNVNLIPFRVYGIKGVPT